MNIIMRTLQLIIETKIKHILDDFFSYGLRIFLCSGKLANNYYAFVGAPEYPPTNYLVFADAIGHLRQVV